MFDIQKNITWTVAFGIHARDKNNFSLQLNPQKLTEINEAIIFTSNPIQIIPMPKPIELKSRFLKSTSLPISANINGKNIRVQSFPNNSETSV